MPILFVVLLTFLLLIYLLRGGPPRIAAFGGWLVGIAASVLAWRLGHSYVWIIEIILRNIDPQAEAFTSLAVIGLLFLVMRIVAAWGAQFFTWLIEWGHRREAQWRLKRALAKANAAAEQ
jgi:hypothetical protein